MFPENQIAKCSISLRKSQQLDLLCQERSNMVTLNSEFKKATENTGQNSEKFACENLLKQNKLFMPEEKIMKREEVSETLTHHMAKNTLIRLK